MGTKYSSQAAVGYNASPVSDDGSATEANKVKASTILTKWTNPLKTFIEAVNTAISTALDKSARAVSASDNSAASDHDRVIQVNTASVTITLADATTMAAGYTVSVSNQSAGDITVAVATATDTIDTVTNATQTVSAKEVRRYIVNSATNGYITASDRVVAASATIAGKVELATAAETLTGTDAVRAITPAGFAGNLDITGAAGYYKLPGGVIIQWDLLTTDASGDVTWTYPTAFSTTVFNVQATARSGDTGHMVSVNSPGLTTCAMFVREHDNTQPSGAVLFAFAIGV